MSKAKRVSTSFSEGEIRALCEMFAIIRRGGDATLVVRSHDAKLAQRKFHAALAQLDDPAEEALP